MIGEDPAASGRGRGEAPGSTDACGPDDVSGAPDTDAASNAPDTDAASNAPDSDAAADCERGAVGFLARREHSRLELERKLAARGFEPDLIADVLDRLEQNGLLSSQRFMASFIASRAARGSGPDKIRAELVQRGIRPDDAAAALREAGEDWASLARRARIKRFGEAAPADFEERARQARFLRGRGFDSSQIDAALEVGAESD